MEAGSERRWWTFGFFVGLMAGTSFATMAIVVFAAIIEILKR